MHNNMFNYRFQNGMKLMSIRMFPKNKVLFKMLRIDTQSVRMYTCVCVYVCVCVCLSGSACEQNSSRTNELIWTMKVTGEGQRSQ